MNYYRLCLVFVLMYSVSVHDVSGQSFSLGSDDIDEMKILQQIEREIGINNATPKNDQKEEVSNRQLKVAKIEPKYQVIVQTLKGDNEITGFTYFYQETLILKDLENVGDRSISIAKIKAIQIKNYKPITALQKKKNEYIVLFAPYECQIETNGSKVYTGILDSGNWIQIIVHNNGAKKTIPLTYYVQLNASSSEKAIELANEKFSEIPENQHTVILFQGNQLNELSSSTQK